MGMSYQFKVAKKKDIPDDIKYYEDAIDKFIDVGPEFDKEDWLIGLIRNHADDLVSYSKKAIEGAIKTLEELDKEVKYILESDEISLSLDFRRRLAKGLVVNIYGYRDYHYAYPRSYYAEDSYQAQNWSEDVWNTRAKGSEFVRNGLKELLPYTTDEWIIWCHVY